MAFICYNNLWHLIKTWVKQITGTENIVSRYVKVKTKDLSVAHSSKNLSDWDNKFGSPFLAILVYTFATTMENTWIQWKTCEKKIPNYKNYWVTSKVIRGSTNRKRNSHWKDHTRSPVWNSKVTGVTFRKRITVVPICKYLKGHQSFYGNLKWQTKNDKCKQKE